MEHSGPLRVLLVGDDPAVERPVRAAVADSPDVRLDPLVRPAVAPDRLAAAPFDLALLAVDPPADPTLAALAGLRRQVPRVPVVVVLPTDNEELALRAVCSGAQDVLPVEQLGSGRLARIGRRAVTRAAAAEPPRSADARFRLLVDGVTDYGIVLLDPAGRIASWNAGAERMTGYRATDVIGRSAACLYVPDDVEPDRPTHLLRAAVERGRVRDEGWRVRKDGTRFWAETSLTSIRGPAGELWGFSQVTRDASERRALEEQIRQSQKMEAVGQLAGGVAHDFNNLLTIINGYSEIIQPQLPAGSPVLESVQEITQAGKRAATLTRQLLTLSRKQVLEPKVLDLNAVVTDLERMLRRLIGEDVTLTTTLDPTLGRVRADPGQLEQVLLNLVVNARDAMPRGGRLTIETANADLTADDAPPGVRPGPYVLLTVTDTGIGMDAETRGHIFEPFFTTKPPGEGTGLGLATVYGIVAQTGGQVAVDTAPGRGAAFRVYLPRTAEAPTRRPDAAAGKAPSGTETILLTEDEDAVRALARHVLKMHGYTVLEAGNGNEALRQADAHRGPIHLLVTDVIMPEMGGGPLADRLTARRPAVKVLFLSGYTNEAVGRHGVREGEVAFLQKPFTPSALARKVREVLDR